MASTIHLHPTAPLAGRVLLPGDPGRALLLAQTVLSEPKMFNHHRGLWGYTGAAVDGELLTIQSTGIGGPSSAIVITELLELGAHTLLRVGTCGALVAGLELGQLIVAEEALAADGTSQSLGAGPRVPASPRLLERLRAAAGATARHGPVVSTDLFYGGPAGSEERWAGEGALAIEMEASTLFTLAARHGFQAGTLLTVSDLVLPTRRRIDEDALREAERRLGAVAVAALVDG